MQVNACGVAWTGGRVLAAALMLGTSGAEAGSAFTIRSQSVASLGSAQAGMTASAQDITFMAFNPAAISRHDGMQAAGSFTGIITYGQFEPTSATTVLGSAIPGGAGGDSGKAALVPGYYGTFEVTPDLTVGLGITTFFGLGGEWDQGWVGRYHALNSDLLTLNITPVVAYDITPELSVGVGFQAQYAKTNLTTAIDFGTIDQVLYAGANGGVPGQSDGSIEIDADDWAFGATAGILWEPVEGTRFGLGYRSQITHDLTGRANYREGGPVGHGVAAASGAFGDGPVAARMPLPDMLSLGAYHEIGERWAVMADVMWMNWSRQDQFVLRFDDPAQPDLVTEQNWNDSFFVALGAIYRPTDMLALRAGVAWDQSPVPDATRNPVVADDDSIWVGFGAEVRPSENLKIDMALGGIFTRQAPINLSASSPGNTFKGNLAGNGASAGAAYFGMQFSYRL